MKRAGANPEVMAICRALNRAYGPLPAGRLESPLNVLIATILSQNTSDVNSQRAYRNLRRLFPVWNDVAEAGLRDIEAAIHAGGLAKIKAARIRSVLRLIRKDGVPRGGAQAGMTKNSNASISLDRLNALSSTDALAWLTSLPGVGLKTACCVLLFGLGRPVMPVDTHVYRLAGRLGWIRAHTPIDGVPAILECIIPARWILPMHLYLIAHGRRICRPQRPKCGICVVAGYCAFALKKVRAPDYF
jgi:endonuclease-3